MMQWMRLHGNRLLVLAPLAVLLAVAAGLGLAPRALVLIGLGFLVSVWLSQDLFKVVMSERCDGDSSWPVRKVLIMGLSPLTRLRKEALEELSADARHQFANEFWQSSFDPVHPHAVRQLEAAVALPLRISGAKRCKMDERAELCGEPTKIHVKTLTTGARFSWLSNLRVAAHYCGELARADRKERPMGAASLERIVVVASAEAARDYPLFHHLLTKSLKCAGQGDCRLDIYPHRIDVTSFADSYAAIEDAVGRVLGDRSFDGSLYVPADIVIFTTAAARPFGIAAAALTINRDIAFCHVTERKNDIIEYEGRVYFAAGGGG